MLNQLIHIDGFYLTWKYYKFHLFRETSWTPILSIQPSKATIDKSTSLYEVTSKKKNPGNKINDTTPNEDVIYLTIGAVLLLHCFQNPGVNRATDDPGKGFILKPG